ncbi:exported protein of unknown function [Azospirillum baldaniorum]|uniref:Glycosyl transferase family 51 domain-containing protein n=1 Tax=Azospirillum baldaniorum TaxID=1064539 RepID=A0A9P1JTG4_9PROT|nr:exported protein of unknown function [Azospirillum baldaniorum]
MRFPVRRLLRLLMALAVALVAFSVGWAALYRVVPVPATPLMLIRAAGGSGLAHDWVPMSQMSPHLARAVIASEDTLFCGPRRLRLGGHRGSLRGQRGGPAPARRQHDQPADRQERLPLAGPQLDPQGRRGVVHPADRDAVAEEPHPGGLPEHRGVGRRRLRRRGRRPPSFQEAGIGPDPPRGRPSRRRPAQPPQLVPEPARRLRGATGRRHRAPHGGGGTGRAGRLRTLIFACHISTLNLLVDHKYSRW